MAGNPLAPVVRIGVTGHRDISAPDRVGAVCGSALGQVLMLLESARWQAGLLRVEAAPARTLGYRIVSPLAEGADRIIADLVSSTDVALAGRLRELVVPLPFGLESYRGTADRAGSDCPSPQSQAEFDRLRGMALRTWALHPRNPDGSAQRNAWYAEVGRYVVGHSDVLFALWDGRDNGLPGGTAAIMRLALQRGMPVVWIPVTRRRSPARGRPDAGEHRKAGAIPDGGHNPDGTSAGRPQLLGAGTTGQGDLYAALRGATDLAALRAGGLLTGRRRAQHPAQELLTNRLARLAELERYARTSASIQGALARELDLASVVAAGSPADSVLESLASWIVPSYVVADGLAARYRNRLRALNIGVYAAAATAVTLGAFAAILFPYGGYWRLAAVFEAAVLISLLTVQSLDVRKICRDRWVAFRAMGELLRIGRFFALVGPPTGRDLEFSRIVQQDPWSADPDAVPWFAPVIERAWDLRPETDLGHGDVTWLRDYLIAGWIDRQIEYYERRRDMHHSWETIFQRLIRGTLLATVLAVILHMLRDYLPGFPVAQHGGRDVFLAAMAFLAITLTSVAAALNGYSGQQRHAFHFSRFRRMASELIRIRVSLSGATTMGELRAHVEEVRRVTAGEATNWFEDMQEQLIESPA